MNTPFFYNYSDQWTRRAQLVRDSERADFTRARRRAWQGASVVAQVTNDILNAIEQPSRGVLSLSVY